MYSKMSFFVPGEIFFIHLLQNAVIISKKCIIFCDSGTAMKLEKWTKQNSAEQTKKIEQKVLVERQIKANLSQTVIWCEIKNKK